LVEQGYEQFEFLPCIVSHEDDLVNQMNLILSNSYRTKSEFEKMKEVQELNRLIETYDKENPDMKITARTIRKEIAERLGLSETKVANYNSIGKNLSSGAMKEFEAGKINVSTATELAGLDQETQDKIVSESDTITQKEVKQIKEKVKSSVSDSDTEEQLPGQMNIGDYPGIVPESEKISHKRKKNEITNDNLIYTMQEIAEERTRYVKYMEAYEKGKLSTSSKIIKKWKMHMDAFKLLLEEKAQEDGEKI
jgi:hypothetical protein